ncbi:hypothetical protein [Lysobacter sp. CA196]|uniref:hypothetical protein n=1 Tax=Lysobacter sp. CA196 TaxID=3455606 RepID=UPI003F8D6C36
MQTIKTRLNTCARSHLGWGVGTARESCDLACAMPAAAESVRPMMRPSFGRFIRLRAVGESMHATSCSAPKVTVRNVRADSCRVNTKQARDFKDVTRVTRRLRTSETNSLRIRRFNDVLTDRRRRERAARLHRRWRIDDAITYRNAKLKPSLNIADAIGCMRKARKALLQAIRRFARVSRIGEKRDAVPFARTRVNGEGPIAARCRYTSERGLHC